MGKIIISTNVSLDGVVQDPDGQEGFRHGGWFGEFGGADLEVWAPILAAEAEQTAALLLGRTTDAWFAERWNEREGAWADRLNGLPKYVVSSQAPRWKNGTRIDVGDVTRLKRELDGDILVYASYGLARTLIEHDLADELRLFVFPVVLGAGERLFAETSDKKPMRRLATQTVGDGLLFITYEFVHTAAEPPERPARSTAVLMSGA